MCVNNGKPFRNKHVAFQAKYLKFIFVNSSSEIFFNTDVFSMFHLRIYSSLLYVETQSLVYYLKL